MSENGKKWPWLIPTTQDDILKCLVLSTAQKIIIRRVKKMTNPIPGQMVMVSSAYREIMNESTDYLEED